MTKQGFLPQGQPTMVDLCETAVDKLFAAIVGNLVHVLHSLLPPVRRVEFDMRQQTHNRTIPLAKNTHLKKTFINHMLLKDCY